MSDAAIVLAGREGNRIELIFHDHDDEGWLSTSLNVRAGHFAGSFRAMFHRDDVVALRDGFARLQERFDAAVDFAPMQPWLNMAIRGDRHGHLTARCVASDRPGDGAQLAFDLSFDQSYLPELIRQAGYVLDRFPQTDGG